MNNLKKIVKDTILRSDLLSADVSLRFDGSSVYESYCPALVSIIVVSIFVVIFVIKFMSMQQMQNITAFQHLVDNIDSSQPVQNIMFAMTIDGLDMKTIDKYFQFTVTEVNLSRPQGSNQTKVRTQRQILLLPCKVSYWQGLGIQSMQTIFQKRGMSAYYCPIQKFVIQGTSDQDTYIYSQIRLKRCNQTSPFCQKNTTLRDAYYTDYVSTNQYFTIKLFLKDTIISPTSSKPISHYLQRDIFLQASTTTGTVGYVKIADYQINTDTNMLPWTEYQTRTGYYIQRFQTSSVPSATRFLYLKLQKSTKMLTVQRQYGKIDDLLSYIGGLFGLIFYCIQFVMLSYNEYRYELAIGENLFNYTKQGQQFREQDMNFWTYIKYSVYDWLSIFNLNSDKWTQMKTIHETREQVNEQLDVRYMMNRIRYLQNVIEVLITDQQRLCLMLAQLPTLQKIQKIRKVAQFYNKHKDGQRDTNKQNENNSSRQEKYLDTNLYNNSMSNINCKDINLNYENKNNKQIQLTEIAINSIKRRKVFQQNNKKINKNINININKNDQSLNSMSLTSHNQLNSINQVQIQVQGQINHQIQDQINNQVQGHINNQVQGKIKGIQQEYQQKNNEEDKLMIELNQALIKVAQNQHDPINKKIIRMLKPQLIYKIMNQTIIHTQNQNNSIHKNQQNQYIQNNYLNNSIHKNQQDNFNNQIENNQQDNSTMFIQLKKQQHIPQNSKQ